MNLYRYCTLCPILYSLITILTYFHCTGVHLHYTLPFSSPHGPLQSFDTLTICTEFNPPKSLYKDSTHTNEERNTGSDCECEISCRWSSVIAFIVMKKKEEDGGKEEISSREENDEVVDPSNRNGQMYKLLW